MEIKLNINPNQLTKVLELQYLPAEIESDREANVTDYFNNYTVRENDHLSNALRGFPLDGIEFETPKNFKGIVFQEPQRTLKESADRILGVTGTFTKLTYWNYDKAPSAADGLCRALQVLSTADELAIPISVEEMEKELELDIKSEIV